MTDNQVSRAHRRFIVQSRQPLPDPLHGLSAYERQKILLMRPTWSERHRMCLPSCTKEEKLEALLEILFERRDAYDREFHARCKTVEFERANNRYLYNEQHLTSFKPHITSALTAIQARRREQDEREQNIRADYFRRREERRKRQADLADDSEEASTRRKRKGMSR